ncbi:MAG TPA: MFS transporter [Actinomycetota bacterium]|nr:MFS transporter [Actinomycetota bacterium]
MTRAKLALHRTFHAIGHSRNFRLFFFGQAVSVSGTWMQMVATAWLVLRLTNSGVALGIDTALAFGPILLFGALGGSLADRYDKRRILLWTQVAFGALALVLWAIVAADVVRLWMVYGLSFLQGVVTAIDQPTRQSFFAEMVEPRDLQNAVSLNSAVMTGTRIVGPAMAGALIAGVGMEWCFLLNGLSYLAVIGGLLMMRTDELRPMRASHRPGAIRRGLRYVWETAELRRPLLLMSILFVFSFNYAVLMPLFAERELRGDAGTLGLLMSMMGIGSLLGALAMAGRPNANERRLATSAVAVGVVTALVSLAPTLGAAVAGMVPLGVASIVFFVTANSTLQLRSRPEMRGRVMALYGIVFLGTTPIAGPVAGWVGEHLGARVALGGGGLIAVGTGLIGWWLLRRRERAQALTFERAPTPALATDEPLSA